jgi:hypothetical protein
LSSTPLKVTQPPRIFVLALESGGRIPEQEKVGRKSTFPARTLTLEVLVDPLEQLQWRRRPPRRGLNGLRAMRILNPIGPSPHDLHFHGFLLFFASIIARFG